MEEVFFGWWHQRTGLKDAASFPSGVLSGLRKEKASG